MNNIVEGWANIFLKKTKEMDTSMEESKTDLPGLKTKGLDLVI